jgi:rSAM/selenodomain-associated transferase 2
MAPRLSIVVPALNEAANLARLLPDLVVREPRAEVLVVDGGSDDDSRAVVARVPSVRWLSGPRGRARQMNAGARAAQGEVLLFLHADTSLPAGAGAAVLGALGDPAVVGGRFDVRLDSRRPLLRLVAWLMNRRSRLTGISTGDQGIFVRRAAFDALGGYPDIPLMEDVELTRRLKRCGRLAALGLCVTTSARKWEQEGVVRTIALMWTLRLLYALGVSPARLHRRYYRRPRPAWPGPRGPSARPVLPSPHGSRGSGPRVKPRGGRRRAKAPAPDDRTAGPAAILPMEVQIGDRFTAQGFEWEVLTHPAALHGGKSLRARVQRPGLPETEREITWAAHERVEIRRSSRTE